MATQRDKIWFAALQAMEVNRTFTAADIQQAIDGEPPAKWTVRDTLNTMASLGLLGTQGGTGSAPREYYPLPPDAQLGPDPESQSTPAHGMAGPDAEAGYSPRASNPSSPLPYPGSKGRLADWIIDQMPAHDTYVEVFGGAAGVLYNKPRSKYEVYNDINADLTHFFRVLRDHPDDLAEWLQAVPYSRRQYDQWVTDFYQGVRPDDDIERAGRFFALRYMQYLGATSSANGFKTRARRSPARTFDNARRRIQTLADRFDQVIIEERDYHAILTDYDDSAVDVLFYLDPPYPGAEGRYPGEFDHAEFVGTLQAVENDWMVSYQGVPDGLEGYPTVERESRHRMKRGDGEVSETLICNFSPEDREPFRGSEESI